ncbi:MAG: prepilin-type N-terminal cleavage/methylation domain-containing protein [Syntrophobacteraceae bacterium]
MRNQSDPNGFTLIEVLVSLCAMAFAFVALWALHLSSLKVDSKTNHEAQAIFLGNQKIEEMRSAASVSSEFSKLTINGNTYKNSETVGGVYTQELIIRDMTPWKKDVFVRLTWPERVKLGDGNTSAKMRTVELATTLTNLELN